MKKSFGCLDEKTFAKFAEVFGSFIEPGTVVLLIGELGSGKTSFVRYCVNRLGVSAMSVRSPSFSLINVYEGNFKVYHVDLYRIDKDVELFMELEEVLESKDGVVFVEWADKISDFWTGEEIKIVLEYCENGRVVSIESDNENFLLELSKRWSEVGQIREA